MKNILPSCEETHKKNSGKEFKLFIQSPCVVVVINFFLYLAAYFCAYSFWCVYWPCRWILDDYKRKRAINYQLLKRRNTSEVCVFFDVSLSPIIARPTRGRLELCGNYFLHEKSLWTTFEKIKVPAQENEHIIKKRLQKFLKLSILPDSPLLRDENYSFSIAYKNSASVKDCLPLCLPNGGEKKSCV